MRLALVSLEQRWQDKDANFARCAEFARRARSQGCTLAVFPEMTLTGYSLDVAAIAEPENSSPTLARFGGLASETGVELVFGACLLDPSTGRPRNQFCVARPDGIARPVYAKVHPFSFAGEDKVLEAGDTPGITEIGGLRLSCSICYDLRFPYLYSATASRSDAMICIANWPVARTGHWRTLLTARAIENQYFVFGVNRVGSDGNGLHYDKSSLAVAPDGTPLSPSSMEAEMDIYDFDPSETDRYRRSFPTMRDKRYDLYLRFQG